MPNKYLRPNLQRQGSSIYDVLVQFAKEYTFFYNQFLHIYTPNRKNSGSSKTLFQMCKEKVLYANTIACYLKSRKPPCQ